VVDLDVVLVVVIDCAMGMRMNSSKNAITSLARFDASVPWPAHLCVFVSAFMCMCRLTRAG
jgi:hypothetical protein